jgi:hypothetical protein
MVDQDIDRTLNNPEVGLWLGQRQQALRIAAGRVAPGPERVSAPSLAWGAGR